jgi:glycosyltransferase involved in cell wall biosynthesis
MTTTAQIPVSVLIPVKNEETNIAGCLQSVHWADERVVVDSGSQDRTIEIASEMGASIVNFVWKRGDLKKKNWALANYTFRNEWILILDADERITGPLALEIATAIQNPAYDGYYLNRRFFFMGRWIRHAGYFPSWNLRLFRRGKARYEVVPDYSRWTGDNEVHEHMLLDGFVGTLSQPMDHFAYPDVYTFLEKHNRYSTWEARCCIAAQRLQAETSAGARSFMINLKRRAKSVARIAPFPHWARFFYHYILRLGLLDGAAGYFFCHLLAEYEFQIWAKKYEQQLPTSI